MIDTEEKNLVNIGDLTYKDFINPINFFEDSPKKEDYKTLNNYFNLEDFLKKQDNPTNKESRPRCNFDEKKIFPKDTEKNKRYKNNVDIEQKINNIYKNNFKNLDEIVKNYNKDNKIKNFDEIIPDDIQHLINNDIYVLNNNAFNLTFPKKELIESKHIELSDLFANKINGLPTNIFLDKIHEILEMLNFGPLLSAITIYQNVLSNEQLLPSKENRLSVEKFISSYTKLLDKQSVLGQIINADLSTIAVSILKPNESSIKELNSFLIKSGACNATYNYNLQGSEAEGFFLDSLKGGSVHFLVNSRNGSSYTRLYLAVNKDNKPFCFLDCIESNDMSLYSLEGYIEQKKEDRLLTSFLSTIFISQKLGLEQIALGEEEALLLGKELGFGYKTIFPNSSNTDNKLGYSQGPYIWRMSNSKSFISFNPQFYTSEIATSILEKSEDVMSRIERNPKSLKKLKEDYNKYFSMVYHVSSLMEAKGFGTTELVLKIENFCKKYDINYNHEPFTSDLVIPNSYEKSQKNHFFNLFNLK